jgi:hypothetical protein
VEIAGTRWAHIRLALAGILSSRSPIVIKEYKTKIFFSLDLFSVTKKWGNNPFALSQAILSPEALRICYTKKTMINTLGDIPFETAS